jgi:hypothetical protein
MSRVVNGAVIEDDQRVDLEVSKVEIYVDGVQSDEKIGEDFFLVCWNFAEKSPL